MTRLFKLDDSPTPGLAQVEIIKSKGTNLLGDRLYQVRVTAIVKPSHLRLCKVGQVLVVSERLLQEVR